LVKPPSVTEEPTGPVGEVAEAFAIREDYRDRRARADFAGRHQGFKLDDRLKARTLAFVLQQRGCIHDALAEAILESDDPPSEWPDWEDFRERLEDFAYGSLLDELSRRMRVSVQPIARKLLERLLGPFTSYSIRYKIMAIERRESHGKEDRSR